MRLMAPKGAFPVGAVIAGGATVLATAVHLLGIDHKRLTYRYQGRDYRLTDVHGHVVHDILA